MTVEEMVTLIEQRLPPEGGFEMIQLSDYELRALIASWRERGEERDREMKAHQELLIYNAELIAAIAALKDKP